MKMPDSNEIIFESPPSDPDDKIWLERGQKLLDASFDAVHNAAKSLLTGLELITGIYLGILGFAGYIPDNTGLAAKSLFLVPVIFWLVAIYYTLQVLMSKSLRINLHAPDDIREKVNKILLEKQRHLKGAFCAFSIGLIAVFLLFMLHSYL